MPTGPSLCPTAMPRACSVRMLCSFEIVSMSRRRDSIALNVGLCGNAPAIASSLLMNASRQPPRFGNMISMLFHILRGFGPPESTVLESLDGTLLMLRDARWSEPAEVFSYLDASARGCRARLKRRVRRLQDGAILFGPWRKACKFEGDGALHLLQRLSMSTSCSPEICVVREMGTLLEEQRL
ncbi:uncharacterized protein LAESUDRAFT_441261 [Laetiporus sulphureus 93-53]|uniref:Uncharacterized protein n=1 Tax=Laetiporus sulphureus 93-53 TaxID=1314785 RepID=A0A165C2G3_9APHY|nr:uncharacterized protein LAESUDRAFT_441261 [Laetiporus sulphureus 93-53]KZT02081.1 hypothetical protein LAESUDRAFT_441261 [Laetiporus sulphureus 93-53]